MSGRAFFQKGKTGFRRDAEELTPAERMALRRLLRGAQGKRELDDYLDGPVVARKLGLTPRTIRDLANRGEFDGDWGKAFKPAHNRLRIPVRGVLAWAEKKRVARVFSSADAGTPCGSFNEEGEG